jgi:hypothetical protein
LLGFVLEDNSDGGFQAHRITADGAMNFANRGIGALAARIAVGDDVIVLLGFEARAARVRNIGEEDEADADGIGFLAFDEVSVLGNNGSAGNEPGMVERRLEEIGIAAIDDEAVRKNLEDASADVSAVLNAFGAKFLAVDGQGVEINRRWSLGRCV